MREKVLNRLAGAIRDTSHNVVREGVREPQRGVVRSRNPLRVELTNSRLVLGEEDLLVSQEVRRYDDDFGIAVNDTVVLLPVAGEEWVISNVISQRDNVEVPGERFLKLNEEGNHKIAFGTVVVSWPFVGSKSSETVVTHGMGLTPEVVVVTLQAVESEAVGIVANVKDIGDTTFDVYADYVDGSSPGTQARTLHWMAIG